MNWGTTGEDAAYRMKLLNPSGGVNRRWMGSGGRVCRWAGSDFSLDIKSASSLRDYVNRSGQKKTPLSWLELSLFHHDRVFPCPLERKEESAVGIHNDFAGAWFLGIN